MKKQKMLHLGRSVLQYLWEHNIPLSGIKRMGPYYRYHHGENKLTPKQQDDIMQILAQFGCTDRIKFDHYETDWDFR